MKEPKPVGFIVEHKAGLVSWLVCAVWVPLVNGSSGSFTARGSLSKTKASLPIWLDSLDVSANISPSLEESFCIWQLRRMGYQRLFANKWLFKITALHSFVPEWMTGRWFGPHQGLQLRSFLDLCKTKQAWPLQHHWCWLDLFTTRNALANRRRIRLTDNPSR